MKTIGSSMWKWCAGLALAAGLFVAAPQAQADVYLGRDGGLEGTATVDDTVQTAAQAGKWTKNNASQTIAEETTVVRSGGKSIRIGNSTTSGRRVWTPLLSFGSKTTSVTIQYYRQITNSTSFQSNQVGVLRASESLQGTYDKPASINTWEKKTYTPASATFTSLAGVIMHRAASSGAGNMFVDDLCVYDGSADTTAPNSAGTVTIATNSATELAVSWDAASGGVDSGGYLVVRYAAEPAAGDDPNANGIYATNNTLVGSVTGTVVYQGDGTTYTDSGLTTDQTYYYKVYTYDKAYNYAAESNGSGTPASGSASAPSVTTVAAGSIAATTATANGDVTDDGGDTVTERGVCYKTSADVAITDNPTAAAAGGTGEFSVDLSSLAVNQIYYFKAYAINGIGTTLAANELNFTTLANVPAAPTVDNPTATTLDVAVNANGNPAATEFAIQRTSDSLYLQADGTFGAAEDWQTAVEWDTTTAIGLASETEYFFQVKARNGANVETAFGATASGTTAAAPTGIWINPMSAGTPMATFYLGDVMGEWFVNFEIGQTWWDYAQLGIGTSAEGTGYNWGEASWYQDGEGNNKRVRRNLSGYQFTSAANHYVICQAKANSGDDYTSKSGNGWGNSLAYPPADLASAYFAVSAINDPSGQSADADQSTQINLLWSNNAQDHDVMVVRKLAADSWTEPTQGTSYSASDTLGAGTVVYKGDSGIFYDTGLSASTTYDYKFYSVNNDYYSAGVTAQETTLACEPDAPVGLGAVADYTSFAASWDATDRATGYRLDVSTNAAFGIASALGSVYTADFEDSVKGSYASGLTTNNGVVWTFNEAVIGTLANDRKNGSRSARIRSNETVNSTGIISMNSDTNMGLSSITLLYALYGTDASCGGRVEYSTNGGSSWTSAGTFTASSTTLTLFSATNLNVTGNVRVRVVKTSGGSERLNIDDITLYPYSPVVPSFVAGYEDLAVAGTSVSVTGLTEGVTYYFRVRAEGEGGCPSANSTTASTTTLEHLRPSLSLDEVNVREAGQGRFYVRLNQNPAASVVVSVSRTAGSANLSVQSGSALTFNSANWSTWRLVTLAAAADADSTDDTATFRIAMSGADDQFVEATALDDDIGENLALPAGGSTIEGKTAYSAAALIDGVHNVQTNYGYTVWTNLANPGTLTLDLHATSVVSRVRLLNYDWNYRVHQYRIDSSLNGTDWTLLADASTGEHTGWEDWPVANQQMRYLRFTGLSNSMNRSVCVSELEVFGTRTQPVPLEFSKTSVNVREAGEGRFYVRMTNAPESLLVVNVARDSGDGSLSVKSGATLTFDALNWNTWKAVTLQAPADENADDETATFRVSAPGVAYTYIEATALDDDIGENLALGAETEGKTGYLTSQLVDGTHLVNTNYGYTVWTNLASPGTITLDLQSVVSASRMRLLNWDFRYRVHQYLIESSTDGDNWSVLVDASTGAHSGWEDWTLDAEQVRYLRFTGLSNSENRAVCISEWELYGEARENQTITFPNPGTQERTNTVVLSATASSGLPVSFAVASGPASISGGTTLTFSGTGLVSIVASQAGDGNWNPAPNVTNVFNVLLPKSTVDFGGGDVNVREGGEGRFFVRLSEQPANDVVVSVTRSAGDAGISVQSGITMTFTPLTWDTWRAVTLVAAEDENSTDESATIRIVATGVPEQFLQAVALDDDIGENVALASGGATVTGSISVAVTDVIDGIHTDRYNYGYTVWTNEPQDVIDLDLGAVMTVTRMRLLNFDWNYRMHQYQIESSLDGETWDLLVDASTGAHHGWEDWSLENVSARYLRFTGLSNTYNRAVCISEWEVYGTRPAGRRAVKAAVAAAAEVVPTVVLTSDGAEDESGWNAVDGDEETAWVGQQVGGGYVVVGYESALELKSIEVDLAEGSLSGIQYLYSQDGEEWLPLPDLAGNPISLNYLWLVFPDDGTTAVPQVLEILPNP